MHPPFRKGVDNQNEDFHYNLVAKLIKPFFWGYLIPEDKIQKQFNLYFSLLNRTYTIGGQTNVDNVLGGRTFGM